MRRRKGTGGELKRRERERRGGEMREKGRGPGKIAGKIATWP